MQQNARLGARDSCSIQGAPTTETTMAKPLECVVTVDDQLDHQVTQVTNSAKSLLDDASPATRKAVLLLISHNCGMSQRKVKRVLVAASHLKRKYVK